MKKCKVCGVVVEQGRVSQTNYGLYPKIKWIFCSENCKKIHKDAIKKL